jgi:hypothetical protein
MEQEKIQIYREILDFKKFSEPILRRWPETLEFNSSSRVLLINSIKALVLHAVRKIIQFYSCNNNILSADTSAMAFSV